MKIATYNVWNEDKGIGKRFKQLIHEINNVDADIIGLQEVIPFCLRKQTISIVFMENIEKKRKGWLY